MDDLKKFKWVYNDEYRQYTKIYSPIYPEEKERIHLKYKISDELDISRLEVSSVVFDACYIFYYTTTRHPTREMYSLPNMQIWSQFEPNYLFLIESYIFKNSVEYDAHICMEQLKYG